MQIQHRRRLPEPAKNQEISDLSCTHFARNVVKKFLLMICFAGLVGRPYHQNVQPVGSFGTEKPRVAHHL